MKHSCMDYRQVSNECGRQCGGNTLLFGKGELVIYMGLRTIRSGQEQQYKFLNLLPIKSLAFIWSFYLM